jgi:hypothetical protein
MGANSSMHKWGTRLKKASSMNFWPPFTKIKWFGGKEEPNAY